jgi:PEP-CTERM motif
MKPTCLSLFFLLLANSFAHAQPGTVYFTGSTVFPPSSTGGTINVEFDLLPAHTFANGGINFGVQLSNLDIVKFTSAEVLNSDGRWTVATDVTTPDLVIFNAASVLTPGLPAGEQGVVFATIDFEFVSNDYGSVDITFVTNEESLYDPNFEDPRDWTTSFYTFVNNSASIIPEPSTLAMAGLGLIGLTLRRHGS